jgi:hypothetical protein
MEKQKNKDITEKPWTSTEIQEFISKCEIVQE